MAEKKTVTTYESVMRDLKARRFYPIYLLMGEESYFIDKISDYISNNVLQPEELFFNQNILFGSDVTAAQIVDMAKGYPVMPAEHRLIVVKEAQNIRSFDALERYLDKPMSSTILVLRDSELSGFITTYMKTHNAAIDEKSAALVAEHIGSDISRLVSELDKLLISLPDTDRRVTPDVVEHQIGVSKDFNSFELRRAIIERDIMKANRIVNYFDKNPKAGSVYSFLPLLFVFFQNLMIAHYTHNRTNDSAVAEALELKSVWGVKDYMVGMKNYTPMKTMQIISKIREIDAKSKGLDNPNTGSGELMKELIFYILH